jgi:hypothetical protein
MEHSHTLADKLGYGRALVGAGMTGLRSAHSASYRFAPDLTNAARGALKSAAVSAGLALLGSSMQKHRKRPVRTALACATLTFCADFVWRTRTLSTNMVDSARKEMSKARDQHWLESNPVDYA